MITQAAFIIKHALGEFVGVVAFDSNEYLAIQAAKIAWGERANYGNELSWEELTKAGKDRNIYTCNINK